MKTVLPSLLLLALLCASAFAQPPAGEAANPGPDETAPPVEALEPANAETEFVAIEFAGGSVRDLCSTLTELTGEPFVAYREYAREIAAFKIPGEPPAGEPVPTFFGPLAGEQGPMGGAESMVNDKGVAKEHVRDVLVPYVRVGVRPGWLIEPAAEGDAPPARPLIAERDGESIPWVAFEAITAKDLLDQLAIHSRFPIVVSPEVALPEASFPVNVENVTIETVLSLLAKDFKAQAVPVWVAFDLTEDLQAFLEAVTDSEIASVLQLMDLWNELGDAQKQALMQMMLDRFKQFPPEQRAAMLNGMQFMLEGLAGRMGTMDPAMAAQVMGQMQGFIGDMNSFSGTLAPGDRSELAGLFGAMNKLFSGAQAGAGHSRPGR